MSKLIMLSGLVLLTGCTSVTVEPLDTAYNTKHICIKENPKVIVDDFVEVVTAGLARHHITSEFIKSPIDRLTIEKQENEDLPDEYFMNITPTPEKCEYSLVYTARRNWDMAPYLWQAAITISDKKQPIASAEYHLRAKGGLAMTKWQGTDAKISPVMDELLKNYK